MVKKRIAIILARGGSKRLLQKNILEFGGKPLSAWSIEAAINSKQFDKVLVSTDDKKIKDIALSYNAEVPFLRLEASDDFATSSMATYAALSQAEKYWGERYETVAQLMANCPLRTVNDIKSSILAFDNSNIPSQLSCFSFGWMNPWWAFKLDKLGNPSPIFPDPNQNRSQDLPKLYCPSGALWIANRDAFLIHKNFYMPGHRFHQLDWISAMDIDNEADFLMAKACLELNNLKKK